MQSASLRQALRAAEARRAARSGTDGRGSVMGSAAAASALAALSWILLVTHSPFSSTPAPHGDILIFEPQAYSN